MNFIKKIMSFSFNKVCITLSNSSALKKNKKNAKKLRQLLLKLQKKLNVK